MRHGVAILVWMLLIGGSASARAETYPPLKRGMAFPAITVMDEQDRPVRLPSEGWRQGDEVVFFLPVFTRCKMTCPLIVQSLKKAFSSIEEEKTGHAQYAVWLFSFDSADTAADLKRFREHEAIPPQWKIFHSSNPAMVRAFLDQFSYSVMSSDDGFSHPAEALVFNRRGKWTGTLFGSTLSAAEVKKALEDSAFRNSTHPFTAVVSWLTYPDNWFLLSGIGFVILLLSFLEFYLRRSRALS